MSEGVVQKIRTKEKDGNLLEELREGGWESGPTFLISSKRIKSLADFPKPQIENDF